MTLTGMNIVFSQNFCFAKILFRFYQKRQNFAEVFAKISQNFLIFVIFVCTYLSLPMSANILQVGCPAQD